MLKKPVQYRLKNLLKKVFGSNVKKRSYYVVTYPGNRSIVVQASGVRSAKRKMKGALHAHKLIEK